MRFTDDTYQQIHNYLHGNMDAQEKQRFEDRMKSDPELTEELSIHRNMMDNLGDEGWHLPAEDDPDRSRTYREYLQGQEAESYRQFISDGYESYAAKKRPVWYYAAAVVALLLTGTIAYYLLSSTSPSYEAYYTWNDLPALASRSAGDTELAKAEALFRKQAYEDALSVFSKVLSSGEANATIYIYAGICRLELMQYQQSLDTFDQLLQSNLLDRAKAHWYKALVYLRMDERELARAELKTLLTDDHRFFDEEAEDLMELLR